jgi:hypothetical protein
MIELHKPTQSVARELLVKACPDLGREIGADEVHRVIGNGFHEVEKKALEEPVGNGAAGNLEN